MIQSCNVYINIFCDKTEKKIINTWLKSHFEYKENRSIWGVPMNIDVIDEPTDLIVLDIGIDVPCMYIGGYPGSWWEPPEPAYVQDAFDKNDFIEWIKSIIPDRFDIEIEIDSSSEIPSEEELVRKFEEEADYEKMF